MPETANARVLFEGETGRSFRPGDCPLCHADLDREAHRPPCTPLAERLTVRIGLDAWGRRMDDLLEQATRRAWAAWVRAGHRFPGEPRRAA